MVEVRQGTLWIAGRSWTRRTRRGRGGAGEAEGRRRGRTQATDIKSNNPHLAGGEKGHICVFMFIVSIGEWVDVFPGLFLPFLSAMLQDLSRLADAASNSTLCT